MSSAFKDLFCFPQTGAVIRLSPEEGSSKGRVEITTSELGGLYAARDGTLQLRKLLADSLGFSLRYL